MVNRQGGAPGGIILGENDSISIPIDIHHLFQSQSRSGGDGENGLVDKKEATYIAK